MRKIFLLNILVLAIAFVDAQNILPVPTSEVCPGENITFSVSLPGQGVTSVYGIAFNTVPTVIQQPFSISVSGGNVYFNFVGKFADDNNKQAFRVSYTNSGGLPDIWDAPYAKIKSLSTSNSCSQIHPNQSYITAPPCQVTNHTVSFNNVQYGNPFEAPPICYGTITTYQYLLPLGWGLNGNTSDGSTWITVNSNNVTVTSDLSHGGNIKIRPVNVCGSGLKEGQ